MYSSSVKPSKDLSVSSDTVLSSSDDVRSSECAWTASWSALVVRARFVGGAALPFPFLGEGPATASRLAAFYNAQCQLPQPEKARTLTAKGVSSVRSVISSSSAANRLARASSASRWSVFCIVSSQFPHAVTRRNTHSIWGVMDAAHRRPFISRSQSSCECLVGQYLLEDGPGRRLQGIRMLLLTQCLDLQQVLFRRPRLVRTRDVRAWSFLTLFRSLVLRPGVF